MRKKKGSIHAADADRSARLRNFYLLLLRGPLTTMQIIHATGIAAVSAAAAELRDPINGIPVDCRCISKGVYEYSIPDSYQPALNLK